MFREGFPTAHRVNGIPMTINYISFMFFKTQETILKFDDPELVLAATKLYTEESLTILRGQGLDVFTSQTCSYPKDLDFLEAFSMRSVSVFRFAMKFMQLFCENKEDYTYFVTLLGKS